MQAAGGIGGPMQRKLIFEATLPHLILLVVAATLIICGAVFAQPFLLYGAWALFLLWDACFVYSDQLSDRSADAVLDHIGQARTNLSWYIVVFGGAIAYLATSKDAEQAFVKLATDSELGSRPGDLADDRGISCRPVYSDQKVAIVGQPGATGNSASPLHAVIEKHVWRVHISAKSGHHQLCLFGHSAGFALCASYVAVSLSRG